MEDLAHRPKRRRESSRLPSPFLAVAAPPEKRLRVTSPQSVPDNHGDDDVCFISKAEFEQTKRKQPKREDSSPEVDIPSIVIDAIAAARQLCAFAQQIPISKSPDDAEAEAAADKCLRLQTCLHDIFKRRKIELAASIRDEVVGANKGLRNALDKYDDAISMALSSSEEAHEHENTEAQQDHAMMSDDDSMSMDISSSEEAQQSDIEPQQDAATMSDHDRQGSISPGAGQPNAPHDDACECRACRTAWSLHYNYVHVEDPYGAVPRANRVGFENAFGRVFKDQMLLWEALRGPDLNVITHRGNGHRQGNRRLAILGDAAMRLVYLDLWFSEDDRNWGIINGDTTCCGI